MIVTATATEVTPSNFSATPGAVDALVHVAVNGNVVVGEVTLVPDPYSHELDRWGSLDHWASADLVAYLLARNESVDDPTMVDVVSAIVSAVRRSVRGM